MLKWFGNIELTTKFICSMRGYRKTWMNSFANPVSETRLMLEHKDVYMGSLALGVMCVCARLCAKALGAAHTMHIKSLISELRGTQFTEREVPSENLLRLSPPLGQVWTCCCWICNGTGGITWPRGSTGALPPKQAGRLISVSLEESRTFYIILACLVL